MSATVSSRARKRVARETGGARLVNPVNFVLATRDTGYKSTAMAVAELIDNSIQAKATKVNVEVVLGEDALYPIELIVTDNGTGMDARTLAEALSFGGSTRFGDRSSLGRYGMGLPNGALSRARRVSVFTWQKKDEILAARLDVDEIVSGRRHTLRPVERVVSRPSHALNARHGTAVVLARCDRLEYRRPSALARRLCAELGRIYRRFIVQGIEIRVNGEPVARVDPLLLDRASHVSGARSFGSTLDYDFENGARSGRVEVRFTELPVHQWHDLPASEKRILGITGSPCVSVMRAGREIDRGWYFMGAKRRENYDDWWRCEVSFDPSLDELFGITNAKQGITPSRELCEVLERDLEPIARALNARVRRRFEVVKLGRPLSAAERRAAKVGAALPALPVRRDSVPECVREILDRELLGLESPTERSAPYRLIASEIPGTVAFEVARHRGQLVLVLNTLHPFYRDLYGPLAMSEAEHDQDVATHVALTILAAVRAGETHLGNRGEVRRFRQAWSDVLATFFNG